MKDFWSTSHAPLMIVEFWVVAANEWYITCMHACNVDFVVLTLLCVAGSTTPCNTVNCFVDPCSVTTCSAYPTATCRSNYCGGCYADFFDAAGTNVTALCNSVAPTTVSPPLSCPPPTGFGLCVEACTADTVCQSGQICCNTGCGHACVDGIAATQSKMSTSQWHAPSS